MTRKEIVGVTVSEKVYDIILQSYNPQMGISEESYVEGQIKGLQEGLYYPDIRIPIAVQNLIYNRLASDPQKHKEKSDVLSIFKLGLLHIKYSGEAIGIFTVNKGTLLVYVPIDNRDRLNGYLQPTKRYNIYTHYGKHYVIKLVEATEPCESYSAEQVLNFYRNILLGDFTGRDIKIIQPTLGENRKEVKLSEITDLNQIRNIELVKEKLIEPSEVYRLQNKEQNTKVMIRQLEDELATLKEQLTNHQTQEQFYREQLKKSQTENEQYRKQLAEMKQSYVERQKDCTNLEQVNATNISDTEEIKINVMQEYHFKREEQSDGYQEALTYLTSYVESNRSNMGKLVAQLFEVVLNLSQDIAVKKGITKQATASLKKYMQGLKEADKVALYTHLQVLSEHLALKRYPNALYMKKMLTDYGAVEGYGQEIYYAHTKNKLLKVVEKVQVGTKEEVAKELKEVAYAYQTYVDTNVYVNTSERDTEVYYYAKPCIEDNVQEFCLILEREKLVEKYGANNVLKRLMNTCSEPFTQKVTAYIDNQLKF